MKLEAIGISGFRSIEAASLADCGGFNVIIGKNNAGKSNILLGINAFFACIKDSGPVLINPPFGTTVDHYENRINQPINFSITFKLSLAERDALIQDIVAAAPQVKNTVEGMDPDLRLKVTVTIASKPQRYAYVKQILLCKPDATTSCNETSGVRKIVEIGDDAAAELASKARQATLRDQEVSYIRENLEFLSRYDTEDWARLRIADTTAARVTRSRMLGRVTPASADIRNKVEDLLRTSESYSSFREAANSLIASIQEEAADLRSEPLRNKIESFSGQEEAVPPYALNLLKSISQLKVVYLTERRDPIGKREAVQLLGLKVRRGGPEKLRNIQETVSGLLGVEIDAFQSETPQAGAETDAELDVGKFLVQVNGAGIREALRLILDYEFGQPDILLVEEPEIHLHPALETSMMRYLKRIGKESQIFITTHSTNFLDTAEMRNVYLASKDQSTQVQLINMAEAETSIPRELGIRLSSLFMFDRLVFVEGPSDEDVIREWASIRGVNLAQASVGFIPMGGVRNLAYFASDQTISFLTKRRVALWFVLDRDEREDAEVQRLTSELGVQARMVVLERRELENYLIIARPLAEFIKLKKELGGVKDPVAPTVSEVTQAINECAELLKSVAIERRVIKLTCAPVYPNRNEALNVSSGKSLTERVSNELTRQKEKLEEIDKKLSDVIVEQTQQVDTQWERRKTELVPGDILLDEVCKRFGVRFNKERDSSRLAALMERNEIPSEINRLLNELGK